MEFSIPMSCVLTSPFIFEFIITSSPSLVLAKRLYALYKSTLCVILAALNLIFDCLGLELAIAVYRGLPTGRPFLYIPCVLYILIQSSDIAQRHFWPVKIWDSLILKVGNVRKVPASP